MGTLRPSASRRRRETRVGRPPGQTSHTLALVARAVKMSNRGMKTAAIAAQESVSTSYIRRKLAGARTVVSESQSGTPKPKPSRSSNATSAGEHAVSWAR
jgi:hypothetical protein